MNTQLVEVAKPIAIIYQRTNNALHQVIGKSHLPHIGQRPHEPRH